jgi:hypothetical protein
MTRRIFHRLRILDLARGEDAVKKALAEPIERMLDARVLHQVDANAEHTHFNEKTNLEARKPGGKDSILSFMASWIPDSLCNHP